MRSPTMVLNRSLKRLVHKSLRIVVAI